MSLCGKMLQFSITSSCFHIHENKKLGKFHHMLIWMKVLMQASLQHTSHSNQRMAEL